jgi:dynactin complex subunit
MNGEKSGLVAQMSANYDILHNSINASNVLVKELSQEFKAVKNSFGELQYKVHENNFGRITDQKEFTAIKNSVKELNEDLEQIRILVKYPKLLRVVLVGGFLVFLGGFSTMFIAIFKLLELVHTLAPAGLPLK